MIYFYCLLILNIFRYNYVLVSIMILLPDQNYVYPLIWGQIQNVHDYLIAADKVETSGNVVVTKKMKRMIWMMVVAWSLLRKLRSNI